MATENIQLSAWFPPDEAEELRLVAKHEDRSISQVIRLAVRRYIASLKPEIAIGQGDSE